MGSKINYKGIKIELNDECKLIGRLILDEEKPEEVTELNLTDEINRVINENKDKDMVVNIKEYKPKTVERKPVFKYHCGCEESEIKSSYDSLNVHCNVCDEDFKME